MSIGDFLLTGLAKYVVGPMCKAIEKADKALEKETGKGLYQRYNESEERDERLKKENPTLWVAKHLAKGTVKGITGASLHKD